MAMNNLAIGGKFLSIVGSETFEGICFEKYSEGLRYC